VAKTKVPASPSRKFLARGCKGKTTTVAAAKASSETVDPSARAAPKSGKTGTDGDISTIRAMGLAELLLAAKKDTSGIACPEEKEEAAKRIAARHAAAAAIDASGFVSRSASEDGSNHSRSSSASDVEDEDHNAYEGDDGNQSGSSNSASEGASASYSNEDDPNTDTNPEKGDATSIDIDLEEALRKIKSPAVQYGIEKDTEDTDTNPDKADAEDPDTNPDKAEATLTDAEANRVDQHAAAFAAMHRLRQKRSKTVLDGVEDDDEETDTNQDKGEATATVQSLPTFAAQYKVVTDYLERQGFGPDDTPPKGYDRESVTKFLVEKGYCTSESAASSIIPTANTNLAEKQPKKRRPAVKSNAAATSKRKKTAATSFVPETQEDTLVPDTSTADTSIVPSILIALERANTTVPHSKKPKKASSTTHKSKRAPLPVMAPNQKTSTLTSEQAGTCAFYKEYLKAAVHAIAPQDPPQQPFFYVGRGQHDACRWLTDRYWNFHI